MSPILAIRPTRRAVLLFAALLPLVWLALSYRSQWWPRAFDGSALVLLCLALDACFARPLRKIRANVEAPPVGYIGEPVDAAIVLSAEGGGSSPYELALDLGGDAAPLTYADTWKAFGPNARAEVRIEPRRRGQLRIERLWVRWRGPLGLIEQTRQFPIAKPVPILPDTQASRGQALTAPLPRRPLRNQGAAAARRGFGIRGAPRIRARPRPALHRLEALRAIIAS